VRALVKSGNPHALGLWSGQLASPDERADPDECTDPAERAGAGEGSKSAMVPVLVPAPAPG
jgi:hypothetical protein